MTTTTEVRKPAGFGTVTPYLVGKDVPRLHAFLREAFDAEILASHPRPDGSIMHSEVRVGDSMRSPLRITVMGASSMRFGFAQAAASAVMKIVGASWGILFFDMGVSVGG